MDDRELQRMEMQRRAEDSLKRDGIKEGDIGVFNQLVRIVDFMDTLAFPDDKHQTPIVAFPEERGGNILVGYMPEYYKRYPEFRDNKRGRGKVNKKETFVKDRYHIYCKNLEILFMEKILTMRRMRGMTVCVYGAYTSQELMVSVAARAVRKKIQKKHPISLFGPCGQYDYYAHPWGRRTRELLKMQPSAYSVYGFDANFIGELAALAVCEEGNLYNVRMKLAAILRLQPKDLIAQLSM